MSKEAKLYHFVLVLSGFSSLSERIEDALFEAGCDDALLIFRDNVPYLEFDRQATSLFDAIDAAIKDVESANIGAKVLRVGDEEIQSRLEKQLERDDLLMNTPFLGRIRAKSRQKDILSILALRFNPRIPISQRIEQHLAPITDDAELDRLLASAVQSDSVRAFQKTLYF